MARRVIWTNAAWADLESVADFISRDSPYYAAAFVRETRDAARSLGFLANRGRVVPEVRDKSICEIIVQNYRMIYRVEKSRVAILAFIHGARILRGLWVKR
jgi:plasmid stabilization system protein ParE